MTHNVKVPDPVYEEAKSVQQAHDYSTLGEAIRHMCRDGRGYEV